MTLFLVVSFSYHHCKSELPFLCQARPGKAVWVHPGNDFCFAEGILAQDTAASSSQSLSSFSHQPHVALGCRLKKHALAPHLSC